MKLQERGLNWDLISNMTYDEAIMVYLDVLDMEREQAEIVARFEDEKARSGPDSRKAPFKPNWGEVDIRGGNK